MATLIKKTQYCFLIALIAHLLMFVNFISSSFLYRPEVKQTTDRYMPAYIYQPKNNQQIPKPMPQKKVVNKTPKPEPKNLPTSRMGTERQSSPYDLSAFQPQQNFAGARMQMRQLKSEKNSEDKPLLRLLYEATVQQLVYPQIAVSFRETGVVRIRFTVHPDGKVTQIAMVKSSGFEPLDNSAMDAIHAISPVRGVNSYIDKPEVVEAYIEFR